MDPRGVLCGNTLPQYHVILKILPIHIKEDSLQGMLVYNLRHSLIQHHLPTRSTQEDPNIPFYDPYLIKPPFNYCLNL